MLQNKIVVHFQDGHLLKGTTSDFFPNKDRFHLAPVDAAPGTKPVEVLVSDLKAVFFVKDFTGHPEHQDKQEFDPTQRPAGRKIRVRFKDGEEIVGTTQGYQPGRPGFFIVPADAESNNERCYVVSAATDDVSFV
jgi:hypothetical protein